MATYEKPKLRAFPEINSSPNDADVAFVSCDKWGNPGRLNRFVLKEFGYSEKHMPNQDQLDVGYYFLTASNLKTIVFIVTVGDDSTENLLESNLTKAFKESGTLLDSKKLWLPLMGTGDGGLSLQRSYVLTINVLNNLHYALGRINYTTIALPDTDEARTLLSEIENPQNFQNARIESEVAEAFRNFKGNYFLGGSYWSGDQQIDRFINDGIWENGKTGEYIDRINEVRKGDLFFIKSTYQQGGKSMLRIKAVGVVTDNPFDGSILHIDWKLKGLNTNIDHLGYYRDTIYMVYPNDVETLLEAVGKEVIYHAGLLGKTITKPNISRYARILCDADNGEDYLEIDKDVNAFAKIMASKNFHPPLAVSLFGKWGTGKSFFINKLKDRINTLSLSNSPSYCSGIAQVHFNVWSYLDANLWASIVSKIFDELHLYITKDSKAKKYKQEIEKELTQKLSITKEHQQMLEDMKQELQAKLTQLKNEKNSLRQTLNNKIKEIRNKKLSNIIAEVNNQFKVTEQIDTAIAENGSLDELKTEWQKIVPKKYWDNPDMAYKEARSAHTFMKEFFKPAKLTWNVIILSAAVLFVIFFPPLIKNVSDYWRNFNFLIFQFLTPVLALAWPVWKRARETYNKIQPIVAAFWKIKEDFDQQVRNALFENEQKEKALQLEIEQNSGKMELTESQIQAAKEAIEKIEFKITNALATEALYSFIQKRSNSDEYKKQLGIVSVIRNDFEILSDLFDEHNKETQEFRDKFEYPLERIILYIDDLDRCSEDRVVEVLEAVNLLMAFPLFIVVVGVDRRWVKNALIKRNQLQFGRHELEGIEKVEPSNYLEKIFQVPFHLKEATDREVKSMLEKLAERSKEVLMPVKEDVPGSRRDDPGVNPPPGTPSALPFTPTENEPSTVVVMESAVIQDEPVTFSQMEIDLMKSLSGILGNNPRAIKRFVNVYQIVMAHEDVTARKLGYKEIDYLTVMFLLALPIGPFRKVYPSFIGFINDINYYQTKLSDFLDISNGFPNEFDELRDQLMRQMMGDQYLKALGEKEAETFCRLNVFIQRFTFEDNVAVPHLNK